MQPFTTLDAIAVPIDIVNCDTDQIIPARFLRRGIDDPQYREFFFHDLRFETSGASKGFVFDSPPYAGAQIIVAQRNWGCGSSRENAVTALAKNGIRSVIAPSFGDIHYNNCTKRGVLPITLSDAECATLRAQLAKTPGARVQIDLAAQLVRGPDGVGYPFAMEAFDKERLLSGLDDIDLTMQYAKALDDYEARRGERLDWLSP
ncbi:MAG: 3-isopropylmalate/(R)-2-methylmalate dehydratase small subunit [Gammaproteobacteria bacterium]|jgi:3-isopropylmalate/(R)-2-methylmalate dehydratase small subunit